MPRSFTLQVVGFRRATPRAMLVRLDLEGTSFRFAAGQAISLGRVGQDRRSPYSIACSPDQALASGRLDVLVDDVGRSRATSSLSGIRTGSMLSMEGPSGRFVLPTRAHTGRFVFIAGGTGIAPLRAMLWSAAASGRWPNVEIELVHSVRTPAEFAFAPEFRKLAFEGRIRYRQTVTRAGGLAWRGRRGRISRDLLAETIHRPSETMCFVCGPAAMVADLSAMLRTLGIAPARIRYERYSGAVNELR